MSKEPEVMYHIAYKNNILFLEKEVRELMEKGWELQGGIAISTALSGNHVFVQAMVRR